MSTVHIVWVLTARRERSEWHCGALGKKGKGRTVLEGRHKEMSHSEDLSIDGRIILIY